MDNKGSEIISEYAKKKSLEEYLIQNQKYLYRVAIVYVKNKDDAFEVIQNTIYKSLSSIKSLKDFNSLKPWVTKILVNNCIDFINQSKRKMYDDELLEQEDNKTSILDKIILRQALNKLPPNLKIIIVLRFFEDFKIKDISKILDMKESTVKTNLYKALKLLKINLKEDFYNV